MNMLSVRIGLSNVFSFAIKPFETAIQSGSEHIRDAQAGLRLQGHAPRRFELGAGLKIGDVTIAGELVWEGTHIAGSLHVVLTTQGIHAHAFPADIAGRHCEVGDSDNRSGSLAVFGNAKAVIDRGVTSCR